MAQGACFDVKDYCETVFADLAVMKSKLHSYVRELEQISESEKSLIGWHATHLRDIIKTIDWKLEILMKSCPYDWTGYTYDIEYSAGVPVQEEPIEKEPVVGGYVGG